MANLPPAILLMGPTASGKTLLSLKLAEKYPVEIISVDSALVYRGMDIGTSKPTVQTLNQVPHHLIDICNPVDSYSVAQFRADALRLMEKISNEGKIPLLVGGTMLYYRALLDGLSDLPSANNEIRAKLEVLQAEQGLGALHQQLKEIDPVAADKIHPNDPQRIQRALEVYQLTGKPISTWWQQDKATALPYKVIKLVTMPSDRALLHQRIELRFEEMLAEGFIEEVQRLRAEWPALNLDKPSMRAVGYRQVWQYLDGNFDFSTMKYKGIVATRQLAKRQLTWLRREQSVHWINTDAAGFINQAANLTAQFLNS